MTAGRSARLGPPTAPSQHGGRRSGSWSVGSWSLCWPVDPPPPPAVGAQDEHRTGGGTPRAVGRPHARKWKARPSVSAGSDGLSCARWRGVDMLEQRGFTLARRARAEPTRRLESEARLAGCWDGSSFQLATTHPPSLPPHTPPRQAARRHALTRAVSARCVTASSGPLQRAQLDPPSPPPGSSRSARPPVRFRRRIASLSVTGVAADEPPSEPALDSPARRSELPRGR